MPKGTVHTITLRVRVDNPRRLRPFAEGFLGRKPRDEAEAVIAAVFAGHDVLKSVGCTLLKYQSDKAPKR